MQTAYDALVKDCLTKCDSDACKKNFAIVEAHHDFCLHDDVPKEIEVGFHDLEEVCAMQCVIGRLKDPDHSVCEKMDCPTHESVIFEVVKTLYDNGCATKCPEKECGKSFREIKYIHDMCSPANDKSFEWAGTFTTTDSTHTWSMQKTGNVTVAPLAYADPAMKVALFSISAPSEGAAGVATVESKENVGSMKPTADGACFKLTVKADADDSTFTIDTTGVAGLLVYAEHVPMEFERDTHYLYDSSGTDVEPVTDFYPRAFEWAGTFAVADTSHTWSMQAVGSAKPYAYADPAMKIAIVPTTTPDAATLERQENLGSVLLKGDCTVVNDGESMKPAAAGSCFDLTVDAAKDDSTFTIDTTGLTGIAVYAQHVPLEFERDTHYLYDSKKVDIEPIAESAGAGGGHDHDHGHRRLADVDAALHTYEDACNPVGCYIEPKDCDDDGKVDLTKLDILKDRATKKCFMKDEEGLTCPTSVADTSGAQPVTLISGVALVLAATMN
jgi:hypothetical protein